MAMKVKDVMTRQPIVAVAPGHRTDVLKVLVRNDRTGVPVVKKENGTYLGFVRRHELFAKPEEDQLALLMRKDWPTISQDDTVDAAAETFVERRVHFLPVVDRSNKVAGIVTPHDLLILIEKKGSTKTVKEHIRSPCIPVFEGTPLPVVGRIIDISGIFAFPVLNDDAKITGLVTDRDLFDLSAIRGKKKISELGLGLDDDNWSWEGVKNIMKLYYEVSKLSLPKIPVREVMIKKPITVFEKTSISEAARLMRKNDFNQLPVRDEKDRLLAMLYVLDVLMALLK